MPFDFPASPSEGQIFNAPSGPTYVFQNPVWRAVGQGQIAIISDTAPANPANGTLWWESDTGILFVWVNDGNSSQWVQAGGVQAASDLRSSSADMSIGFRTSGNRFVVNDKADLTGTDVMTVSEAGALTAANIVKSNIGYVCGNTSQLIAGPVSGGTSTGILLRPLHVDTATGQTSIDSAGTVLTSGVLNVAAAYSGSGAVNGTTLSAGRNSTSTTLTTTSTHRAFSNPNGNVGNIQTNASATAYVTSSDERLKNFIGPYDPQEAIAIIRADPVREFTWKVDGTHAVGWGAQTSYAIDPDLASPPPDEALTKEPGDEDFHPWGVDQGRRTPYLWAALSWALAEIDTLKAKVAALEAG